VCVEDARWIADLETIAMPREPSSAHWMAIQDLCATRLESLGFTVERHAYATGVNVFGVRTGTSEPDREVVLGAHYDHVPGCEGADDNASGVAGMLEAARVLAMADYPATLVAACWDEEERGLIGSEAHAARAMAAGEDIDAVFDFEMIGYTDDAPDSQTIPAGFDVLFRDAYREVERNEFRADFIAAVGDPTSETAVGALEHYADRIGLPFVALVVPESLLGSALLADLRRSDHASFWDTGVTAMMITDTSNFRYASYHCFDGDDVTANLDPVFASQVVRAAVGAVAETLGMPRE
jgi:Zn-dependent M28 family amino/carboxypeptidase